MTIAELQKEAHQIACDHGWWESGTGPDTVLDSTPERIALMHSELSEALEDWRNGKSLRGVEFDEGGKPAGIPIELADVIIRICDFAGAAKIDLEAAIWQKLAFNRIRPHRHGGKRG